MTTRHLQKPFLDQIMERAGVARKEIPLTFVERIWHFFHKPAYLGLLTPRAGYRWETDNEVRARFKVRWAETPEYDGAFQQEVSAPFEPSLHPNCLSIMPDEDDGNEP